MTTPAPLILIVEDEAEIAELLEENLHALGFETCAVRDGAVLLDRPVATQTKPDFARHHAAW